MRRLLLFALVVWIGRWAVLEIAMLLHRRRPLRSAKESPRAPGWMPLRDE
jgi:hypothetical protein